MVKIREIKKNRSEDTVSKRKGKHSLRLPAGYGVGNSQLGDKSKDRFFSELSMLLESGIDLHSALTIISEGASKLKEREVFQSVKEVLVSGGSLFEALNMVGRFSQYDCSSVKIGEETGQLPAILMELSSYYSRKIKQNRLIMKSLSYPVMVLLTAIAALVFMLSFVVPMFEDVFLRSGNELPVFTRYIIKFSGFFRERFIYVSGAFVFIGVILFLVRDSAKVRSISGNMLLRLPFVGKLLKLFYLEKLFHSLSLLSKAKVPVHESLELVNGIISFEPINRIMLNIREDVMKGESLASSMGKTSFYDKRTVLLIKIGEEVNKLDEIFEKLYKQVSDDLEHQIGQFGDMLEPLLIIFVGVLVALILIAMYLPIFQLGTSVF